MSTSPDVCGDSARPAPCEDSRTVYSLSLRITLPAGVLLQILSECCTICCYQPVEMTTKVYIRPISSLYLSGTSVACVTVPPECSRRLSTHSPNHHFPPLRITTVSMSELCVPGLVHCYLLCSPLNIKTNTTKKLKSKVF